MEQLFFDQPFVPDLDRVDGKAKVTGTAKYSAEYDFPGLLYGVMVGSTIAKGTILSLDTKAAEKAPGVVEVFSHINLPAIPGYEQKKEEKDAPQGYQVFKDNLVRFAGQPIALVVADTLERAQYAATLVKAIYKKEQPQTDLYEAVKTAKPIEGKGGDYKEYLRGKKDAWQDAPVKVSANYSIPIEVHNPMEMHGITVVWEGDKVTVYEKTQWLKETQDNIMKLYNLPEANVRVISQYIGGAFGSAFNTWPHAVAAVIAGKKLGKPVKVTLNRSQMFTSVGYRPQAFQTLHIGATKDGKIVGITHEATAMTSAFTHFTEGIVNISRSLYNTPNVYTSYKLYPLDLGQPTWMRGPGEATGTYALESAIDEMAYALNMDPLSFRLLNYADTDPERNRPHSSKFLKEAYKMGADAIGWNKRNMQAGVTKEGEWLAGYGMGTGVFIAWRGGAKVGARLNADGTLVLQSGVTDMGPGTATAMTQLASQTFGIPAGKIKFELGDTNLPPGPMQGGSGTTSTLGTTVNNASVSMKKRLHELVKENSLFHTEQIHEVKPEDLVFENGYVLLATDRSKKIAYTDILKNAGIKQLDFIEESKGSNENKYSSYSYSAHFVKVLVNPLTGVVKVDKVVSAIDAGKIVNEKTARSQIIGGVVGGIGMTFMEEGIIDHRFGKWINNNFADYHVPVNADIPKVEVLFVNKPDPILNPMGSKGMGEVSLIGFAAAAANAVFHATGKRVRDLPITPDKLI